MVVVELVDVVVLLSVVVRIELVEVVVVITGDEVVLVAEVVELLAPSTAASAKSSLVKYDGRPLYGFDPPIFVT